MFALLGPELLEIGAVEPLANIHQIIHHHACCFRAKLWALVKICRNLRWAFSGLGCGKRELREGEEMKTGCFWLLLCCFWLLVYSVDLLHPESPPQASGRYV